MNDSRELLRFLKEQIAVEKEIVNSLDNALAGIKNPAVKGTLRGISLDSFKHAEMYSSAIAILTGETQALEEKDLDRQRALVEKHIELEVQLIRKISEKLPEVKNEKVRLLLEAILADEKRHHELLKLVLNVIVKGETITEEEWFEFIWKSVPFHGAPGG
ncbi:MAG: ferritin-like domain-containing protein [Nitrososphaerota archaeon]|nr:ferritin-like domain-containing protein [Candidatus Bathyarchaeota archaeon]MDW8049211.1 ferritin-like domain-containing protein [Nitrososphaerota archaeon]